MTSQALWGAFLEEVTSSPSKHYLWLRSLSYLEYIGYRKMVKALDYQDVHKGVFHHLTDEIQHSFMLKELAEKCFLGSDSDALFSPHFKKIAEDYFQEVDDQIHGWVCSLTGEKNPFLCYMLVSYIIEKRAMKVYPTYFQCLKEAPSKYIIQKIIKDESEHLTYLEDKLQILPEYPSFRDSKLLEFEDSCFSNFLQNLKQCFEENLSSHPIH